jgi:hypothetical protein
VYPAAFLFWPGATFPHTTLREYSHAYGFTRTVADALVVYLNWPRLHATLALVGLGGVVIVLVSRWRALSRPLRHAGCAAIAVTIVTLMLLPSTPYSAGNGMTFTAGLIHWDSMRYVALLPMLGWAAFGRLVNAGIGAPPWRAAVAIVAGTVAVLGALGLSRTAVVMLGGAVVIATIAACLEWPRRVVFAPLVASLVAVGLIAALAWWWHDAKAAATAESLYRERLFGPAMAVLDRQPRGTRVAIFGDQSVYPTFGAQHHLEPVRLDRDGRVATAPIGDGMEPGNLTVDAWSFRTNLFASGIGIVAIVHLPHPGRSAEWPAQAAALDTVAGAHLIYRDAAVGLWRLDAR